MLSSAVLAYLAKLAEKSYLTFRSDFLKKKSAPSKLKHRHTRANEMKREVYEYFSNDV
jgi:hypothetical protein